MSRRSRAWVAVAVGLSEDALGAAHNAHRAERIADSVLRNRKVVHGRSDGNVVLPVRVLENPESALEKVVARLCCDEFYSSP